MESAVRILVTGSRGFIGSAVGRVAASEGHILLGVGLASQANPGWLGGYQQADVAHSGLADAIGAFAPDVLVHAAGSASVGNSFQEPLADLRASVLTWANTLDGVRQSCCRPVVVYLSSAAVYGNPAKLPVMESDPFAPISPYGFHKSACEVIAEEFATCFNIDITVLRIFSLYGPLQRRLLIWELYAQAISDQPELQLQGTGKESRDYLHVDDLAALICQIGQARLPGLNVFNAASGRETTVEEVAETILAVLKLKKPVIPLGREQLGQPRNWQADISKISSTVQSSLRSLNQGLADCIRVWQCS